MPGSPHIVILAGPNGAGKTTAAPRILRGALRVPQFINADVIARGLAGFDPDSAAFEAGRIMLSRMNALVAARVSFAFETTLAARSLAPWLQARTSEGYETNLVYLWLPSADMAVERVEARVRRGGHNIPQSTVRRRYSRSRISRSLHNLARLFIPIVSAFRIYNNAGDRTRLIARGWGGKATLARDKDRWHDLQEHGHDSTE